MPSIINRSRRQWVFGNNFIVPAGVPTAKIVPIPERLHLRGPNPATHERDDAKDAKCKAILEAHLDDPNTGLERLPADGAAPGDPAAEKARSDENATLRDQVAKLQRLVAAGDAGDLAKELEAANRELQTQLELAEEGAAKARSDAKALFDQLQTATGERDSLATQLSSKVSELGSAQNRITELEGQLKAALQPKKK